MGADRVGDGAEAGKVDGPGIGRPAADDQPRPVLLSQPLDLVEIDAGVFAPDAVLHGIEPLARQVGRRAVGEMAAGGERHAHDRIARLAQGQHHALVGLGAGMRLDIGEGAVEQPPGAFDRHRLGDIDILAAAIVAAAGIAFGIFVGEHRALRLEHGSRHDVFRCDQLDLMLLAPKLLGDCGGNGAIGARQPLAEKARK